MPILESLFGRSRLRRLVICDAPGSYRGVADDFWRLALGSTRLRSRLAFAVQAASMVTPRWSNAFERTRCSALEAKETAMTETKTVERAKQQVDEGKRPSTAAGEFVREEMHHIREGKHGARSTKQAIAIGLSKARRAGVPLKPPSEARL